MRRLAELALVREGEGGRAARLGAFLFVITASIVLLKGAQRGIFLAAFPRTRIPDAFMVSAGGLVSASFVVTVLAARVNVARLVQGILLGGCVALGLARLGLTSGHPAAPFAVYVVVEVISGLLLVQAWQVAAEALDVRNAKRLLPLLGSAAGVAWTLGGFLVGGVARAIGAPSILLVAIPLLLGAATIAEVVLRKDLGAARAARARTKHPLAEIKDALAFVASDRLVRLLAMLSIVDLLIEQVMDFQLFCSAQTHYAGNGEAIAGFMGKLYGATGAATVIIPLVLSGRLLTRLGSTRCLLGAQAWVFALSIVFLWVPTFSVVVAMIAGDRVLKQALSNPGRAQMQSPIPAVRRAQTGALTRGVLAPAAYLAGGAVLKIVTESVAPRWTALATIAFTITLLVLTARGLRGAYRDALRRSLDQRRLDLDGAAAARGLALDREQTLALHETVKSGEESRAAFAVSLLADGDPQTVRPFLREACGHASPVVRAAAVEALGGMNDDADIDVIARTLDRAAPGSAEDDVRRACLAALVQLERRGCGDAVRRRDDDPDLRVRALARASLARAEEVGFGSLAWVPKGKLDQAGGFIDGEPEPKSRLGRFLEMLRSPNDDERAAAAWAMGEVAIVHPIVRNAFAALLHDPAPAVKLAALRACGHLGEARFVEKIVLAFADRATSPAAFEAFSALADDSMPAVDEALEKAPTASQTRVAAALAEGTGPSGDRLLARLLASSHRVVRYRAARAIAARARRPGHVPPPPETIAEAMRAELRNGHGYWAIVAAIARTDGVADWEVQEPFAFLAGEVKMRIRQTERRLLALLALVAEPRVVQVVETGLRSREAHQVARAVELLEHSVPPEIASMVVPFLEPRPLRMRLSDLDPTVAPPPAWLEDPLAGIVEGGDPYLRACALTCYRDRIAREQPAILSQEEPMLPLVERICFLRGVPLFHELGGEDLRQVAVIAGRLSLPEGRVVFKKGDPGDELYIVARGRVEVREGSRVLATLRQNEFFGELAILDGEPRSADAVCVEETELLSLRRADMEELIERRPEIAREIIRVLTRRIRETNLRTMTR